MVHFTREADADIPGPFHVFLVLCMCILPLLGQLVFDEPTNLAFQLNSDSVLQKVLYIGKAFISQRKLVDLVRKYH